MNKINYIYQHLFNTPTHPFFMDLIRVEKITQDFIKHQEKIITKKIDYKKTTIPDEIILNQEEKVLKNKDIVELNKQLNNIDNYKMIFKIVSAMSHYTIESNVSFEEEMYQKISKETDKINCMIIGSGPIGLFLACYLDLYYNRGSLNNYPNVNIVLYDNRMNKPGFRRPYTRNRPFNTISAYLSTIVPKIYCMNKTTNSLFVNIFVLEYILFTKARIEHKIPMIYKDYDWDDYKDIMKKGSFDVVFDCTGGRLKTDLFNNIDTSWLDNIDKINTKINKQLLVLPEKNIVHIVDYPEEKKFKKNHFYSSLVVTDRENTFIDKFDIDIMLEEDLKFLSHINKKNYNYNDMIMLLSNIKDDHSRNFLYNIIINEKYKNMIFYFDTWAIYIRHTIQPATMVDNNTIYIMAGDSVFHSHFITGAGLNRTINFAVKCANIIIDMKLE